MLYIEKTNFLRWASMAIIIAITVSCDDGSKRIAELEAQKSELETRISEMEESIDFMSNERHVLEGRIELLESDIPPEEKINEDDKAIRQMVEEMHKGWEDLFAKKDPQELLEHFTPKYTTNGVRINIDNKLFVGQTNETTFPEVLNAFIEQNPDTRVRFSDTQFMYTEVKGDIFATCYRSFMRTYQGDKVINRGSVTVLLTGRHADGWKVGNYNWVGFNYGNK